MSDSTGLGWSGVVAVATFASIGTYFAGHMLEEHRRRRARRELAATILAEITSVLEMAAELDWENLLRNLHASLDVAIAERQDPAELVVTPPSFPPTVYEHCADRVGTLGVEVAAEVVRFYNRLAGFRSTIVIATASEALPFAGRKAALEKMLEQFPIGGPREQKLKRDLNRIAFP